MRMRLFALSLSLITLCSGFAGADTDTLLLIYTNDMHDHARPGYDGRGGLPYVAGAIAAARGGRPDVLIVDSGDVMEKGDMVAHRTDSMLMYEVMGRIGYDAGVPGNHDYLYGIGHLLECGRTADMHLVCVNLMDHAGKPVLPPSVVVEKDGIRIGIIGVTKETDDAPTLSRDESGALLRAEAARLEPDTGLIVAVCHLGVGDCVRLSEMAPAVDVFVAGHKHEVTRKPRIVEETGAYVVEAGHYSKMAGTLDLVIDTETEEIVGAENRIIELDHDTVRCDESVRELIAAREQAVCPEASRVVAHSGEALGPLFVGLLVADALRAAGQADIGFCHPGKVLRSGLPKGEIDINALFISGGSYGRNLVETAVPGSLLAGYLEWLLEEREGMTAWSGFSAAVDYSRDGGVTECTLDPDTVYRMVMTEKEWDKLFADYLRDGAAAGEAETAERKPCAFTFTEAFADYAAALTAGGIALDMQAKQLDEAYKR